MQSDFKWMSGKPDEPLVWEEYITPPPAKTDTDREAELEFRIALGELAIK
jgi:hypothetical protein